MSHDVIAAPESATHQRTAACSTAAWDCQTHTFLGSPETVAENLASLPEDLVKRRVYMLMIQGDGRAEARIFERFDMSDADGTVARWQDDSLAGMVMQLTDVLVSNRGVHCPGEQVKAALEGDREFTVSGPSPAPATPAEAFGPVIAEYSGHGFVQASVMVLC